MTNRNCGSCRFWHKNPPHPQVPLGQGSCRINPPTALVMTQFAIPNDGPLLPIPGKPPPVPVPVNSIPISMWPGTGASDWCSKHEFDTESIRQ